MNDPQKPALPFSLEDPFIELASRIFVGLASVIYSAPRNPEQKKPNPKVVAAMSFKLAEAFQQTAKEVAARSHVKVDEVDLSGVFQSDLTKKP